MTWIRIGDVAPDFLSSPFWKQRSQCGCCEGKRVVPDIDGNDRPCSRCRPDEFNRWSERRRHRIEQEPAPARRGDTR
jgi:hypothetical protein